MRLPFWRYFELYRDASYSFLLDSAKESERLGQYSFMGGDPTLVYRVKGVRNRLPQSGPRPTFGRCPASQKRFLTPFTAQPTEKAIIEVIELVDYSGQRLEKPIFNRRTALPFDDLRQLLVAHRVDYCQYVDHPVPFLSGAVGYFGYESGYFIEELPDHGTDDLALPDIYLMFVSTVLAHCHRTGRSYLSILGRGEDEKAARRQAEIQRENILSRIAGFESDTRGCRTELDSVPDGFPNGISDLLQIRPTGIHYSGLDFPFEIQDHFDKADYCRAIKTIKEHISAGDVYQVCLTRRLDTPLIGGAAWDLYKELRQINPAPFAAFLNFPEVQVVSSSPERFLRLGPDGMAESRPIKGTRPRGATPAEDDRLRDELRASAKDRAENVMIVDLVRNDFGRVCAYRSVEVPEFLAIEDYATVFQMVSTICGRLAEGRDSLDLIQACFPGGSMTGARRSRP